MKLNVMLAASLLAVAGCSGLSHEPPASLAQTAGSGPPDQQPQSTNSLPPGSQVNAPFTTSTGIVSTTRVAPPSRATRAAAPASSVKEPEAGTATATAPATPRRVQDSY